MKPRLTTKTHLEVDTAIDALRVWADTYGALTLGYDGRSISIDDPATWRELAALLAECADLVEGPSSDG